MSLNSLKKNLVFSSVEVKELIDQMVSDESYSSRRKPSAILETSILDSLLTINSQVRFWIRNLYNGETTGDILCSVFSYNAAGVNWESNHLPLLPFIEFAISEQKYIKYCSLKNDRIYHLVDHLDSLKQMFEHLKDINVDFESKQKYKNGIDMLEFFITSFQNEEYEGLAVSLYRFFKQFWDDLKDSTHSFRVLADLAFIQSGWRNNEESRFELTQLLKNLAYDWPEEMEG